MRMDLSHNVPRLFLCDVRTGMNSLGMLFFIVQKREDEGLKQVGDD